MSYILDALRKSEEERQRGTVPDLLTLQGAAAKEAGKNRFLSFLLLAVLLFNACIFIWWLSPWRVTRQETAGGKDIVAGSQPVAASPAINAVQGLQGSPASQPQAADLRKEVHGGPVSSVTRETGSDISSSVPQATRKQLSSDSQQGSNTSSEEGQKLLSVKELPLSVQQSLPEMSISVHYYASNPASRMVSINGRTMEEGQEFTAGLKLEEITRDGAIFRYQNYRFHIGLKQSLPAE